MGLVYPHIDIKDTEEASLLQLDATDNTVLIPVPFVQRCFLASEEDPEHIITSEGRYWDPDEEIDQIGAKLYTDAQKFIDEWAWGGGEWHITIDAMNKKIASWDSPKDNVAIKRSGDTDYYKFEGSVPRYCFDYSLKIASKADGGRPPVYDVIFTPEKSYLMVIELLKRGLPVLVKPIPVKWEGYASISQGAYPGDDRVKIGQLRADDSAGNYHLGVNDAGERVNTIVWNRQNGIVFAEHNWFAAKIEEAVNGGAFDDLVDKNLYPIKFITSGAYPNIGNVVDSEGQYGIYDSEGKSYGPESLMYSKLTELAQLRGDSIAILELKENIHSKEELRWHLNDSDFPDVSTDFEKYKLAAAFTPWCEFSIDKRLPYGRTANGGKVARSSKYFNLSPLTTMPAGFAYLMAYAYSIQTNASWWAAAGVMRGQIPQMVRPLFEIGESLMHLLQGKDAANNPEFNKMRLNPIMNTGSYGYRIWGNRMAAAFKDLAGVYKTMYSEFLNVRMLLCDIKKQIYAAAMRTTFEPNDDITWVSFKVLCSNLLDRMKSGRGLLWYKWHKEVSEERATIKAKLTVRPIEAVEHFDITVFLTDQDAEVEE